MRLKNWLWAVALAGGTAAAAEPDLRRALANYQVRGGRVTRDEQRADRPVITVDLHRAAVTDADLAPLARLPDLLTVDVSYTPVRDAGLAPIKGLTKLKRLACTAPRSRTPGWRPWTG
jgi:hypothetical protein